MKHDSTQPGQPGQVDTPAGQCDPVLGVIRIDNARVIASRFGTMSRSPQHDLLATLAEFDQSDGASLELVAWELSREASTIASAWELLLATDLIRPVGADLINGEMMYRLTAGGWAALHEPAELLR
jgi:hypothetical protein